MFTPENDILRSVFLRPCFFSVFCYILLCIKQLYILPRYFQFEIPFVFFFLIM